MGSSTPQAIHSNLPQFPIRKSLPQHHKEQEKPNLDTQPLRHTAKKKASNFFIDFYIADLSVLRGREVTQQDVTKWRCRESRAERLPGSNRGGRTANLTEQERKGGHRFPQTANREQPPGKKNACRDARQSRPTRYAKTTLVSLAENTIANSR